MRASNLSNPALMSRMTPTSAKTSATATNSARMVATLRNAQGFSPVPWVIPLVMAPKKGNLFDARRKIAAWRKEYNEELPHSSLGYKTPKEFAAAEAARFYRAERETG